MDDHYAMLARAVAPADGHVAAAGDMAAWALAPLAEDLNTPLALTRLRDLRTLENVASVGGSATAVLGRIGRPWPVVAGLAAAAFREAAAVLGICPSDPSGWLRGESDTGWIEQAIAERLAARKARDFARADAIRAELSAKGIILEDGPQGTVWKRA